MCRFLVDTNHPVAARLEELHHLSGGGQLMSLDENNDMRFYSLEIVLLSASFFGSGG